jgi:hypothetical protein
METIKINDVEYTRTDSIKKRIELKNGLTYAIIRTYSAGCFAGYIDRKRKNKKEATVFNARRLWYWSGASSLSQLAMEGVKNPDDCKFPCEVDEVDLSEIIEVIPATEKAKKSIDNVTIWEQ